MSRSRRRTSVYDDKCEHDINHSPIRKGTETTKIQHRTHSSLHMPHLGPSASCSEEPVASPSGLEASGRLSCCSPSHRHRSSSYPSFPSSCYPFASYSSSSSSSCSHRSDSSSSDSSDYSTNRGTRLRPAQRCMYWLDIFLLNFFGFVTDVGRYLYSLCSRLPLDVILLRGDYKPLRRKALAVAGLTVLALLACWFWVPILSPQPSSGAVATTSATNLAKIQQQLMDIQKELEEKEARLLKEITSLQNEETITSGLKLEFSNWLQDYLFAGSSSGAEGVVLWPELRTVLESMEKRLAQQEAACQDVQKAVREALNRYRNDGTGMPDYALIYSGGKVIKSQYTEPHCPKFLQLQTEGPTAVIQPEVYPGQCWAFRGSYGSVTIALSQSVNITHVTMEHLPKSLSPTGQIDSAAQDFAVYGISHVDQQQQGDFIGKFTYSTDGDPIQTFEVKDPGKEFYPMVELRILTNWGNPMYTCVYRFRVHGHPKSV